MSLVVRRSGEFWLLAISSQATALASLCRFSLFVIRRTAFGETKTKPTANSQRYFYSSESV
jgi:hypothetical protein